MTETRPTLESIKEVYDHLFNRGLTLSKLKDAAVGGRLLRPSDGVASVAGRSVAWKLFLLCIEPLEPPLDTPPSPPMDNLRRARKEFSSLLLDKMRAPDGSYEEGLIIPGEVLRQKAFTSSANLETNNPLSLHDENPWKEWFTAVDLRKTIQQDVERTFPDIGYFRDQDVQRQLTNILFLYSTTHPDIGYRQGMHELLAPLYYAVDYDSLPGEADSPISDPVFLDVCSRTWVAADAWALFSVVMRGVSRWYEWREGPEAIGPTNAHGNHVQVNAKPYIAPIVKDCIFIHRTMLRTSDPVLYNSMENAGIEPQIYGIRWLRLLFTREFEMQDAMVLWDGLFACAPPTFDLMRWICVAMLIRIRNKLIPSDYSTQLTYLLRYPPCPPPEPGAPHHALLLLRQAIALEISQSTAAGASLMIENRNLLNIPIEVPDVPLTVRRGQPGQRGHHVSSSESFPRAAYGGRGNDQLREQSAHQMGIPEMIARGLLDRGESLGINKTVMNAVSELKRNLPELAASLVRSPLPSPAPYAAFPLHDDKIPEERPYLETRSRFEVERAVRDMRQLNKKLGESVGRILDALLQDEESADDSERLMVRERKRQALESLSYVRDVLNGNETELDEERLWGEEEYERRKDSRIEEGTESPGTISDSGPAFSANVSRPSPIPRAISRSRSSSGPSRSPEGRLAPLPRASRQISRIPPPTSLAGPSFVRSSLRSPPQSPPGSSRTLTPNYTSTQLTPWSLSPSPSRAPGRPTNSAPASAPLSAPPRTSANLTSQPLSLKYPPTLPSLLQVPPSDQSPRASELHDPLGVLS